MRLCYISIKGQWLNDLRSGEGTLRHQSGLLYEGMWTSDQPVEITTGMEIRVLPAELHPGERFIVEVECLTDRGIAFHGQLVTCCDFSFKHHQVLLRNNENMFCQLVLYCIQAFI